MKRMVLGAGLFLALATPAQAGTLVNAGGVLTYTDGDAPTQVGFASHDGFVEVRTQSAEPTQATGCEPGSGVFRCPGVTSVVADAGGGDDIVGGWELAVPMTASGGAGHDRLYTGQQADRLDGGPGDDEIVPGPGDTVLGGPGIDAASVESAYAPSSYSLNDVADDGVAGTLPLDLRSDIEDIRGLVTGPGNDVVVIDGTAAVTGAAVPPPPGPLTLVGSAAANSLQGTEGSDVITGNGGMDRLSGSSGDDTLLARDGVPDRVECGAGADTAVVDQFDQVGESCETVQLAAVSSALDDRPPTVAWTAGTALAVTATDDRGVAKVDFILDGRPLCTDAAAPYTCAFAPTVKDVGRHAVVAIVTDIAGQTGTAVRVLTVPRFQPTAVTLRVRGRTATGKVTLPAGVPCAGEVQVGGRTATLRKDCTYRVTVKRARSYVAKYLGTPGIAAKRSKRVRA